MATILPCKIVAQVAFKAGGDVFHDLVAMNPKNLTNIIPGKIQACDLHHGDYGTNDSIIEWKYNVDGQDFTSKQVLEGIDTEKHTITWRILEGHLADLYKDMHVSVHVETKDGVDFVTWTLNYELRDENNPHPLSHVKFFIELTKEMETHILG